MPYCQCPGLKHIPNLHSDDCPEQIGQIQKLIIMRCNNRIEVSGQTSVKSNFFVDARADAGNVPAANCGLGQIGAKATWDRLMVASDGTKAVITPTINNPTTEGGEKIEYGGNDNTTAGGAAILLGYSPVPFTCELFFQDQRKGIKPLSQLDCEGDLGVIMVTANNGLVCWRTEKLYTPTTGSAVSYSECRPIPIRGFSVSPLTLGGLTEPDKNTITFQLYYRWSDDSDTLNPPAGDTPNDDFIDPDFRPLIDIRNMDSVDQTTA